MKKIAHAVQEEAPTPGIADSVRDDPFLVLVAEHQLLRQELVRAAVDLRRAGKLPPSAVKALVESVRLHLRREDHALLPACERLFGGKDGAAAVLRKDHAAIDENLADLVGPRALDTQGALETRLERLQGNLDRHFSREERVLFPLMAALLRHPEAAAIAHILGTAQELRLEPRTRRSREEDPRESLG